MKTPLIILALSTTLITTAAIAGHGKYDTDGDGAVSLAEIQAQRPNMTNEKFAKMDTNNDGLLQRDEMKASMKKRGSKRFEKHDANGDGVLELAELQVAKPGFPVEKFNKLDVDGSGTLSKDEMQRSRHNKMRKSKRFAKLDTDGSGGLSFDEMRVKKPEMTLEDFNQRDVNGDGEITRDEGRGNRNRDARNKTSL